MVKDGRTTGGPGAFYPPTVLADVTADAPVLQQATFGPVAPVVVVESDDETVGLSNDIPYT